MLAKAKKNTAWKVQACYELENEHWMSRSVAIALVILKQLKTKGKSQTWLADEIGCSRQYLSKILKGRENLTLETIGKLERALAATILEIKGLSAASTEIPWSDKPMKQNRIKQPVNTAKIVQEYKLEPVYVHNDYNQDEAA